MSHHNGTEGKHWPIPPDTAEVLLEVDARYRAALAGRRKETRQELAAARLAWWEAVNEAVNGQGCSRRSIGVLLGVDHTNVMRRLRVWAPQQPMF